MRNKIGHLLKQIKSPGLAVVIAVGILAIFVGTQYVSSKERYVELSIDGGTPEQDQSQKERSIALFGEVAKVLNHPRCLNCHPTDNYPRQGDDMHRHMFNVQRGLDDKGAVGMRCVSCHGPKNNEITGVPGVSEPDDPNKSRWHLAPLSMGWIGLSDAELGKRLLDTEMNGGMTPEDLLEHMEHDPLVLWAWDPGSGREKIPISHEDFVEIVTEWVETGAHVPNQ